MIRHWQAVESRQLFLRAAGFTPAVFGSSVFIATRDRNEKSASRMRAPSTWETRLAMETLDAQHLLSGLPTLIDIVAGAGASDPFGFTNVNATLFSAPTMALTVKNYGSAKGLAVERRWRQTSIQARTVRIRRFSRLREWTCSLPRPPQSTELNFGLSRTRSLLHFNCLPLGRLGNLIRSRANDRSSEASCAWTTKPHPFSSHRKVVSPTLAGRNLPGGTKESLARRHGQIGKT